MPVCKRRSGERGLAYEIKCIEETIKLKKKLGKDTKFEQEILRAYKKLTEADLASRFEFRT